MKLRYSEINLKKALLAVLFIFVMGVGLSFILIPRDNERALINLKDQKLDQAKDSFQKELDSGNKGVNVMMPLVDVHVQEGNVDKAIQTLKDFIKENPNNIEARKKLASIYQLSQKPQEYKETLEELRKYQETPDLLKELAAAYNVSGEHDKQEEVIRTLLTKYGGEKQSYIELAYLQAENKKYDEAAEILIALKTKYPDQFDAAAIKLLTKVLVDNNKAEDAFKHAEEYLKAKPEDETAASIANMIFYSGYPDLGLKLLDPFMDKLEESPYVLTEYARFQVYKGNIDVAYEKLSAMYEKQKLPTNAYEIYIEILIRKPDNDKLKSVVASQNLDFLSQERFLDLIYLALSNKNMIAIDLLKGGVSEEYVNSKPLAKFVVELINNKKNFSFNMEEFNQLNLSVPQKLKIAKIMAAFDYKTDAIAIVKSLNPQEIPDENLYELAEVYIEANNYSEGYATLSGIYQTRQSKPSLIAWAIISIASGKGKELETFLDEQKIAELNDSSLANIYFYANQFNEDSLALKVSQALYQRNPTDQHASYYSYALVRNKQYDEAIKILRYLANKDESYFDEYVYALSKAVKNDASLKEEYGQNVKKLLDDPKYSEKTKISYIYSLVENKDYEIAKPYVEKYKDKDKAWRYLYETVTGKRKQQPEFVDTVVEEYDSKGRKVIKHVRTPRAAVSAKNLTAQDAAKAPTRAEKKRIAHDLLAYGKKEESEKVFFDLANDQEATDSEIAEFLYVLGYNPKQEHLDWIVNKAKVSNGKRLNDFIYYLSAISRYDEIINILDARTDLAHSDLIDQYVFALKKKYNDDQVLKILEKKYVANSSEKFLRYYLSLSPVRNNYEAIKLYESLEQRNPEDAEILNNLGKYYFYAGAYSKSKDTFVKLHKLGHETYASNYYLGEMARRDKYLDASKGLFQKSYEMISATTDTGAERDIIYANLLNRMGYKDRAEQAFIDLVSKYPNDNSILADYKSFLYENRRDNFGQYIEVNKNLAAAPSGWTSEAVNFDKRRVREYRLLDNGKKVVIVLNEPVDKQADVKEFVIKKTSWISSISASYNSLLILTKPGVKMEVTQNSNIVSFYPARDATTDALYAQTNNQDLGKLRLGVIDSLTLADDGRPREAISNLNRLHNEYPESGQPLYERAGIEHSLGKKSAAKESLQQAKKLDPMNENIDELYYDITRNGKPSVQADYDWRRTGKNHEHIVGLTAVAPIGDDIEVSANHRIDYLHGKNLREATSGDVGNYDVTRNRGDLTVRKELDDDTISGSVYWHNKGLGAGAQYVKPNEYGVSTGTLEYNQAYWDVVEGVLNEATRSSVRLDHFYRYDPLTYVTLQGSYNWYDVDDFNNVTQTVGLQGSIGRTIYRNLEDLYSFGVSYIFDGQYRTNHKTRVDRFGNRYDILGLKTNEVHAIDAIFRKEFDKYFNLDAYVGYAIDRYTGDGGPRFGAILTKEFNEHLEMQLRANKTVSFDQGGADYDNVGGYLRYRF